MIPCIIFFMYLHAWTVRRFWKRSKHTTLRWRHNGRDGVSNHQPHDGLLNPLFIRRSKKISKLCVTGLCVGNSSVNAPQKWPVTRKMFPFHHDIMTDVDRSATSWFLCCRWVSHKEHSIYSVLSDKTQQYAMCYLVVTIFHAQPKDAHQAKVSLTLEVIRYDTLAFRTCLNLCLLRANIEIWEYITEF